MITQTSYSLDEKNCIVSVDGDWDRYALENDAGDLFAEKILGKSIYDFISGSTTRAWFETIVQMVRMTRTPIERPYRCDSPTLKRYMKMRVSYDGERIHIVHDLLSVEERKEPVLIKHVSEYSRYHTSKHRCSSCGRVHQDGQWYDPDDAALRRDELNLLVVAYVVCETCQLLFPNGAGE